MSDDTWPVTEAIIQRRSIRKFAPDPISPEIVRDLIELACTAPAPHHSRPWRFVHLVTRDARTRLAEAMTDAWLEDMTADARPVVIVDKVIKRSRVQLMHAPAIVLACLALDETKSWDDETRRLAERDMFVQSLGAALQNMLLGAVERGLAAYLKGAPLFCGPAITSALKLPREWQPAFLVLIGYPEEGFEPPYREPVDLDDFVVER